MDDFAFGGINDVARHMAFSEYMFIGVLGALYFFLQHSVIHFFLRICYPGYSKMNSHDFHEYRMQWNAFVHAIFATFFSLYCMFYTCPNNKTFFDDEECRLVVRNSHVLTCFFTASYLLVDTIIILVWVPVQSPIDK